MHLSNLQDKVYPSPGRCIYCGSNGGPDGLRDEHIIPFSLGGDVVLEQASCRDCEKITSYLDGYLARHIFGHLRIHGNLPTRRPKKRPDKLPATFEVRGKKETLSLPIKDHPAVLTMPIFQPPSILRGEHPTSIIPSYDAQTFYNLPESLSAILGLAKDEVASLTVDSSVNVEAFCRAIAKIAYAHAVAIIGLNAFRPLVLPQLILGKYQCPFGFVGSTAGLPPPRQKSASRHLIAGDDVGLGRLRLLLTSVRLFANAGTDEQGPPVYLVVTGASK